MLSKHRRITALTILGAAALGVSAFLVTREFTSNETVGASQDPTPPAETPFDPTPDLTVTPDPDATPDRDQPGWYVPYLNRERELPKFSGTINGIEVGHEGLTAAEWSTICEAPIHESGTEAERSYAGSTLSVEDGDLPGDMELFERPTFTVCPDFGPVRVVATVRVPIEVPGGSPGSGAIEIQRFLGRAPAGVSASEQRWSSGTINGQPAAILRPVIEDVGDSAIIAYDESSNITTFLYGGGLYLGSLEELMEEILQ